PTPPIPCLRFSVSLAVAVQDSGPSGSLLLSRKALSSSTSCRFIPAHCNCDFSTVILIYRLVLLPLLAALQYALPTAANSTCGGKISIAAGVVNSRQVSYHIRNVPGLSTIEMSPGYH